MIKSLENAVQKLSAQSEQRQRYAAAVLERIASAPDDIHVLSEAERHLVEEGLAELDKGEVATEAEVRAVFDKYRA